MPTLLIVRPWVFGFTGTRCQNGSGMVARQASLTAPYSRLRQQRREPASEADMPQRANADRTLAFAGTAHCRAFGTGQRREDLVVLFAENWTILRNWFLQPAPQPLR